MELLWVSHFFKVDNASSYFQEFPFACLIGNTPTCTSIARLYHTTGDQIGSDNSHVYNLLSPNPPSFDLSVNGISHYSVHLHANPTPPSPPFFTVTRYTSFLHSIAPLHSERWIIGKCRRMVWTISFTGKYIPIVQRTEWATREVLCEFSCIVSPVRLAGHISVHRFSSVTDRGCF
jgi:hypothetical protein